MRSALAGATLIAASALAAGPLGASGDGVLDTTLVSRAGGAAGAVGDQPSRNPSITADGRYVAFESAADNLGPDANVTRDIFVRDLQANTTTLVSRATGAAGTFADGNSNNPSISADGRYVAFQSDADNLDPDSDDDFTDVFVRDLQQNTTTLVSRATEADGDVGDNSSSDPSISADGQEVAFDSSATNLAPDPTDGQGDIFVRDLQANTTTLVSRAGGATGVEGNGVSEGASISADGRRVAFESTASNIDTESDDNFPDVFLRDLDAATTTLVSRASGASGAVGDAFSQSASISADGRRVAFSSTANNLGPGANVTIDIFVRDLQANTTTLASRATGTAGAVANDSSLNPSISADGHLVAFASDADNLDSASNDSVFDIFARDLEANTTTLVSRATGAAGAVGNDLSNAPSTSADGRQVAFWSNADNLDPDSDDGVEDVFVRELFDPIPARCAGKLATKVGTAGKNKLRGTPGRDVIAGLGGNDVIRGLAGKDILCGGKGRDRLLGGRGRDTLLGGRGRDTLLGQAGRDRLRGGPGRDKLRGGPGRDTQFQ